MRELKLAAGAAISRGMEFAEKLRRGETIDTANLSEEIETSPEDGPPAASDPLAADPPPDEVDEATCLVLDRRDPNARVRAMQNVNPAFIPRNHRVEQALDAAIEFEDFSPFADLLTVLSRPYEDQEAFADYAKPPQTSERVFQTFCGT
jgi:serine/tyrosine/threonine adenylyltransferase